MFTTDMKESAMPTRGSDPGSIVLSPTEIYRLQRHIQNWEAAANRPHGDATTPLVDLGCEIREMLDAVQS